MPSKAAAKSANCPPGPVTYDGQPLDPRRLAHPLDHAGQGLEGGAVARRAAPRPARPGRPRWGPAATRGPATPSTPDTRCAAADTAARSSGGQPALPLVHDQRRDVLHAGEPALVRQRPGGLGGLRQERRLVVLADLAEPPGEAAGDGEHDAQPDEHDQRRQQRPAPGDAPAAGGPGAGPESCSVVARVIDGPPRPVRRPDPLGPLAGTTEPRPGWSRRPSRARRRPTPVGAGLVSRPAWWARGELNPHVLSDTRT